MPATESENRLMGETRDTLVEGVQQAVKDKVQAVENAATNAVSQVQQAVGLESSESTPGTIHGAEARRQQCHGPTARGIALPP